MSQIIRSDERANDGNDTEDDVDSPTPIIRRTFLMTRSKLMSQKPFQLNKTRTIFRLLSFFQTI
ncbi:hypothetical protein BpHYR1_013952 [Brachionus plicatilis]|uniref:Uncharacterized protein n=1 Tax=Brachionus plicatilis TaxID=10195 RepID=A0A3M7R2T7_BRAPC|nr:hypothetical protein BpHYR1_013952 [Brachionus plicatilis]